MCIELGEFPTYLIVYLVSLRSLDRVYNHIIEIGREERIQCIFQTTTRKKCDLSAELVAADPLNRGGGEPETCLRRRHPRVSPFCSFISLIIYSELMKQRAICTDWVVPRYASQVRDSSSDDLYCACKCIRMWYTKGLLRLRGECCVPF